MAVLGYLPNLKRGLGLAFSANFLHDFSIYQEFISMVEKCVEDAEEKVNIAEMEVGGNHFKKILKSVPKFLGVSLFLLEEDM